MYHTTVCTTLACTWKTGDSLTPLMHTNMHTQCWFFFSCKSKINVVFRNFVLTQICVHDIFDVFMCNNIRLYQALPIIICTSPNVDHLQVYCHVPYNMIFSMFLSNQNHLLTSIYTFTISVHSFDKCDISIFLPRQYRNFNCCTYKYVIETLSWINGYFFSAGCNLCTLYNHILFKNLLKSEATRII